MSHNGKLHSLSNFDFRSRIVELRKDKKLCDITIQLSDNSQLTAHKAIVYTFCKTAEVLCSDNTIVIPMPDISIEVLQHVLSFIYGEMIIVEDKYIGAVDILAHYLGVDDLIRVIAPFSHEIKEEPPDSLNHNEDKPIFHATIFNDIGSDFHDSQDIANGEQLNSVALTDSREAQPLLASNSAENDGIIATETHMWIESRPKAGPRSKRNKKKDGNKDDNLAPVVKLPRLKKLSEPLVELKNITSRFPQLLEGGTIHVSDIEIEQEPQVSNESINDDGTRDHINNYESDPDGDNYDDYDYNMTLEPSEPLDEADTAKVGTLSADVKPLVQESISTSNRCTSASINTPSSKQTQPIKQKKKANEPPTRTRFNTRRSNTEELVPGILTIQKPPKPRIRPAIDKERKKFLEEIRKKKAWMEKEDREWIPRSILKEKKKKAKTEKKKHNKLDDHPKEDTDNDIAASLETEGSDEDTEVDEEMELLYSDAESSEGSEFDVDEVGTEQPAALAVELGHLVKVGHKYKCFYCTKQCSSHDEVYSHIKVDHPDIDLDSLNKDELNCPVCGQHFKTLWRYLQHTSVCTTETYSRCKSCPLCDKATTDLSAHMKYYHHERNFKCQKCDKYFPRRYALKNHIKIVHVEEEFLCEICAVSVKSQAYLKTHMLMVHGTEEDKKHICETCGKKFFKKSTLNEHSKIHSKILDRECDFCDKKFYTKTALRNHQNRNHMDMIDWKFSCDKCSKPFHTQHHLKRHIQMKHSGNKLKRKARKLKEEKPCKYRCAQCHLEFHIKCKFDSHAKWHENPCKCEFDNTVCWRSFATETGLHSHLEADHDIKNSQLTFICKMCDEVFKDIFLHRKHVAVEHEGKHLVDCDLCNCAFEKRKCLTGHKFKKHGITLSWKCSVCNLRFGSSNALIAHQTVHNGKRLVVCRLCGLVFGNTAYRQKHWVHVHKIRKLETPDDLSGLKVQPFILAKNIQSYKDTNEAVHIPIDLDNPVIPHIEEESTPEFKHEGSGADSNIMPVKIADPHPPTSKRSESVLLPLNQSFIPSHSMDTILQSEPPITGQVNPLIPGPEPVNPLIPCPEPVNPLIPCPEPVNSLIPFPEPINPLIPRQEPVNPLIPGPEPGNSDPSDIWL